MDARAALVVILSTALAVMFRCLFFYTAQINCGTSPSCSETRTVTLTTGAPPAAVRALAMERGGDWVFLANSESIAHKKRDAFALGAAPSSSEASRGLNESSFDCNRMISKTLRSLTDAVNGLFSEAEILENFGQSFRLGYANRQLKDQLREARDQLSSARRDGVRAGVEAATKAISASMNENAVNIRKGNGMSGVQLRRLNALLFMENNDERDARASGPTVSKQLRKPRTGLRGNANLGARDMLAGRPCDGRHESRAGEAPAGPFEGQVRYHRRRRRSLSLPPRVPRKRR